MLAARVRPHAQADCDPSLAFIKNANAGTPLEMARDAKTVLAMLPFSLQPKPRSRAAIVASSRPVACASEPGPFALEDAAEWALYWSCCNEDGGDVMEVLLSRYGVADPNSALYVPPDTRDEHGDTPLHVALKEWDNGGNEVVELLLKANPNQDLGALDAKGQAAWHLTQCAEATLMLQLAEERQQQGR